MMGVERQAGPARHVPVLLAEALDALAVRRDGLYVDGTFGAGGYTQALIDRGARVIGLDRDPKAIAAGASLAEAAQGRLTLVRARFGDLERVARELGVPAVDGIVLDIGVSSMQLDEAERGFSLRYDAPLDMRMESEGRSAADILSEEDEATIADILFSFGEESASRRIARVIVADRQTRPFVSTLQLAGMIARVAPAKRGELTHPATRSFQALRIAVNDELGELQRGARRGGSVARRRRPARRRHLPFARGPHRQTILRRAGRDAAAPSRACCPANRNRSSRPSSCRIASRSRRARRRSPPIRARGRRSCATPSGPRRRRVGPDPAAATPAPRPHHRRRT